MLRPRKWILAALLVVSCAASIICYRLWAPSVDILDPSVHVRAYKFSLGMEGELQLGAPLDRFLAKHVKLKSLLSPIVENRLVDRVLRGTGLKNSGVTVHAVKATAPSHILAMHMVWDSPDLDLGITARAYAPDGKTYKASTVLPPSRSGVAFPDLQFGIKTRLPQTVTTPFRASTLPPGAARPGVIFFVFDEMPADVKIEQVALISATWEQRKLAMIRR